MTQPIVISIDPEGTATYLVNEHTRDLFPEAQEPRRASHVEPMALRSRLSYRTLRRAFGDDGRVADWTRSWPGPWRVDLSPVGGPVEEWFPTRADAIDFEIEWLNKFFLGKY